MYGITDPLTFIVGTILIVLLPGPNSLFVLSVASARGVKMGYRAAMGVFAGDTVLMLAASMGAASLLMANPFLFAVLKYAGAAYLSYIGIGLIRLAWQQWTGHWGQQPIKEAEKVGTSTKADRTSLNQPFRRALFISLINPKAILFFMSFFVQFVDASYTYPGLTFLLLGAVVQICSFLYLTSLIFAGSQLASLVRRHPRVCAFGGASVGVLFIAFGVRLANATLSG